MQTKYRISLALGIIALALQSVLPAFAGGNKEKLRELERQNVELQRQLAMMQAQSGATNLSAPPSPLPPISPGAFGDVACADTLVGPPATQPPAPSAHGPNRPLAIAKAADGRATAVIIGPGWEDVVVEEGQCPTNAPAHPNVGPAKSVRQDVDHNKGVVNNTTINVINSPGANVSTASGKIAKARVTSLPIKGGRRSLSCAPMAVQHRACGLVGGMVTPQTYRIADRPLPGGLQVVSAYPRHQFEQQMERLAMKQAYDRAWYNYYQGADVYGQDDEYYGEEP